MARMSATRRAAKAKRGSDPTHVIGTGDRVQTGHVRAPRKVQATDRRIKTGGIHGSKESPVTEFAQNRHEFDYVRKTPATVRPVTNGSVNHVRIAQLPTGTKPVWR